MGTRYRSRPSLTIFSPIKATATVLLASLFATLIITGRFAFVTPIQLTGAELAAVTDPTDQLVEVDCDRIRTIEELDSKHVLLECDVDDYALTVPSRISTSGSVGSPSLMLVGQLELLAENRLALHSRSPVLMRFLVITCAIAELALLALLGSWLRLSGRRPELRPTPAPRTS